MSDSYSSKLLEKVVNEFSRLPGVGGKTALRYTLYMLRQKEEAVTRFVQALSELKAKVCYCQLCHNISDTNTCEICANSARDQRTICVVAHIQDVLAIEKTQQYRGVYHVLGGVISPMDGIGPADIEIDSLIARTDTGRVKEVILALNPTMEGDTTNFYISRRLADRPLVLSVLSRGVSVGNEIEYTDEVTLGRSLINRTPLMPATP